MHEKVELLTAVLKKHHILLSICPASSHKHTHTITHTQLNTQTQHTAYVTCQKKALSLCGLGDIPIMVH